jgi:GldL N-terminal domain
MKQKIYILGLITVMVIFLGTIFKVNHWPGAGIMLTAGLGTFVLAFIPLALISSYRRDDNKRNKLLYLTTGVTCFVIFTAMLFKFQHWPYAGLLLTIALPFPYVVFLPVFLAVTSKDKNYNIYNTVFVLFLLVVNSVFSAMLALSVPRDRINDSLNLARNYNKTESLLVQFPGKESGSPVCMKVDDALKIVDEYRETILKQEELTVAEWKDNPGNIWRPESTEVAARALENAGDSPAGNRLYNGLKSLLSEIEKTPGCAILAKTAPAILDLKPEDQGETITILWNMHISLAWALIYLDDLETDLLMIKNTLASGN